VESAYWLFCDALHCRFNLSIVFQLAHVEETTNPSPNELGEMDNTWAIHQLFTTTNFAPKNAIVNWYTGGLNHQSTIFFQTSVTYIMVKLQNRKRNGSRMQLTVHEYKTMRSAVIAHFKHLKELGQNPAISA
jgi:linoleoyl-CoA desaturase